MSINAYYNGIFCDKKSLRIPLSDRAIFFGDGIYDAAVGMSGKIFMLREHINRFFGNAKKMDIPICYSENDLKRIFDRLLISTKKSCFFLYFQLTRYSEERCHAYPCTDKSNLLVTVSPIPIPIRDKTLRLSLEEDLRHELCDVKTLNLIGAVMASHSAKIKGKDEAVLHKNGTVTECAHSNIHIVKDGTLITHPLDNHILPGISRAHLLSVCKRIGISAKEQAFTVDELFEADEVLITSSSKIAARASNVESREFILRQDSIGKAITDAMFDDFFCACK